MAARNPRSVSRETFGRPLPPVRLRQPPGALFRSPPTATNRPPAARRPPATRRQPLAARRAAPLAFVDDGAHAGGAAAGQGFKLLLEQGVGGFVLYEAPRLLGARRFRHHDIEPFGLQRNELEALC